MPVPMHNSGCLGSWELILSFLISAKGRKEVEKIQIFTVVVLSWIVVMVVDKDYYCWVQYTSFRIIYQVSDILELELEIPNPVLFSGLYSL